MPRERSSRNLPSTARGMISQLPLIVTSVMFLKLKAKSKFPTSVVGGNIVLTMIYHEGVREKMILLIVKFNPVWLMIWIYASNSTSVRIYSYTHEGPERLKFEVIWMVVTPLAPYPFATELSDPSIRMAIEPVHTTAPNCPTSSIASRTENHLLKSPTSLLLCNIGYNVFITRQVYVENRTEMHQTQSNQNSAFYLSRQDIGIISPKDLCLNESMKSSHPKV